MYTYRMNLWNLIDYTMDNYLYYMSDLKKHDYRLEILEYNSDQNVNKIVVVYCDYFEYIKGELHIYINKNLEYKPNIHTSYISGKLFGTGFDMIFRVSDFNKQKNIKSIYGDLSIIPTRKTLKFIFKKK